VLKLSEKANLLSLKSTRVSVPHHKNTIHQKTVRMPIPQHVKISMDQHRGIPCNPVVKVGDYVKVGQLIAKSAIAISAPIHASVSGEVISIEEFVQDDGQTIKELVIRSDKVQTLYEELKPPSIKSKMDFFQAVKNSGLVGLGGAAYPTHVKLNSKSAEKVELDVLLINGAECEPYITSDSRELLESPYDLLAGIQVISHFLNIKKVIVGIEDQNKGIIKALSNFLSKKRGTFPNVSIKALPYAYPQGAEKILIKTCTGRVLPPGKLPIDVGVIVLNVSTTAFLARYFKTGIPLTSRRVTVDGSAVSNPRNVWVPIGTMIKDIIAFCGGYKEEPHLLLQGGIMMGTAQANDDQPITKRTNAVLAFGQSELREHQEIACIRCARCVDICPTELMPGYIDQNVRFNNLDQLKTLGLDICLGCGLCSFICPSNRTLVQSNSVGKKMLHLAQGGQSK